MTVHVEVAKHKEENNPSVIRRFTKRVQESGVLVYARTLRHHTRPLSKAVRRKQALKLLARRETVAKLIKLGKMTEKRPTRGRSSH
jgi:ribosomal protein S21